MDHRDMLEAALDKMMGDLDDIEGKGAVKHSLSECPNPEECDQHSDEMPKMDDGGEEMPDKKDGHSALPIMSVSVEKMKPKSELGPEDIEMLKKLLAKK